MLSSTKNLVFSIAVVGAALLQVGCADMSQSPNLQPSAIRSSFDNVNVRIVGGQLLVDLHSNQYNLASLHVLRATTSTYSNITKLSLMGTVSPSGNPNQVELKFEPAPSVPFSVNLTVKVDGHPLSLRATYYGSKSLTY
jgi:hypothetical protein